ncbi:IS1 family transposase, partial [Escherichia coli]
MASISIRCPSCSATEGVVRNGKSLGGGDVCEPT